MEYAILKSEVRGTVSMIDGHYIIDYNESPLYEIINETNDEYCILKLTNDNYSNITWVYKDDVIAIPKGVVDFKYYQKQNIK